MVNRITYYEHRKSNNVFRKSYIVYVVHIVKCLLYKVFPISFFEYRIPNIVIRISYFEYRKP